MRAYEFGDAPEEKSPGWKGTLAVRYRKAFSFLRPAEDEPGCDSAKRQSQSTPGPAPNAPASSTTQNPIVSTALAKPQIVERSTASEVPAPPTLPGLPSQALRTASNLPAPSAPSRAAIATSLRLVDSPPQKPIWPSVLVVFALTSAITFGLVYFLQVSSTLPKLLKVFSSAPSLGLKVDVQGDRLLVTWNRQHPLVEHARDGFLLIEDGEQRRQIRLDASHVASGSILYHPNSDDVTFQLEVHGSDGKQAIESMRVLDSSKPIRLEIVPQSSGRSAADLKRSPIPLPSSTGSVQQKLLLGRAVVHSVSNEPSSSVADQNTASSKAASDMGATTLNQAGRADEDVQATPEEQSAKTWDQSTSPTNAVVPPRARMPQASPEKNSPLTTPSQTEPDAAKPLPSSISPTPVNYQPPRPLRQVLPNVSVLPAGVLAQASQLEVLVKVDERGRVTEATPVQNGRRINPALLGSAVTAARQWKFEPATMHGKAIASQHSIVFQFAPRPQ